MEKLTQEDLQFVMKEQLKAFNNEKVEITDDTVHSEVVSMTDGFEESRSAIIYPALVKWTIHTAGNEVKPWPHDWLSKSVKDLAAALIVMLLFLLLPFTMTAQKPLTVNLSAIKTDLKNNAIHVGINYLKSVDSILGGNERLIYGKQSVIAFTPVINIETGNADAFSSITGKLTGLAIRFKTKIATAPSGNKILMPDASKTLNTFPMSVGVETNSKFDFINALAEVGWVPWYQSGGSQLSQTKFGIFLQSGYKFKIDTTGKTAIGGQKDESEEDINSVLFRTKGSFGVNTNTLIKIQDFRVSLVGNADLWYDFINGATYYRIEGAARINLTANNFIDLSYQKGSGAPNFNTGDQFGVGLTIAF